MKILFLLTAFASFQWATAQAPNTLVMDGNRLVAVKKAIASKDPRAVDALQTLQRKADSLLNMKPVSVMEKAFMPESGNKHDYMSQAPYFWYDSSKPNGRPYLRRDGQRNPEIYKITDRTYLGQLDQACRTLALAWWLTGQEKYAAKASSLLQVWFINADTKMNPNLDFGQAVPGVNSGRGIGIIETIALTGIADAAILLQGSSAWTSANQQALKEWYSRYLDWMLTSKNGREEHAAKNNHGTWYFAQAIDFAMFTGNHQTAGTLIKEAQKRLDSQLTAEGTQPLELERTNGLGYSTMNLHGWFTVATLARLNNIDLWQYKTANGASLRKAFDWLLPYAMAEKPWPYQQISKYNTAIEWYPLLLQASAGFNDQQYRDKAASISHNGTDFNDLLYTNN